MTTRLDRDCWICDALSGIVMLGGGGGKGGSPSGSTTTSVSPWAPQQPYLLGGFQRAADLAQNNTPQYYDNNMVAHFTAPQNAALDLTSQTAGRNLAGYDPSIQGFAGNLASGGMLNSNPSMAGFSDIGATNLGQNNYGTGLLDAQAYNEIYNPATSALYGQAYGGVSNPGSSILDFISRNGSGYTAPQIQSLNNFSANNVAQEPGNQASGGLGQNQALGLSGTNDLAHLAGTNFAALNPANPTLGAYSSGMFSGTSPYTSALAESVLSQVVPSIQSQFIQGGALNSPEAARATAAGATAALAPSLFQNYQQQQQNQLNAAGQLSNNFLQGAGLQGSLAQGLGGLGLQAGSALENAILSGRGQQIGASQSSGQLGLGAGGLQEQAASTAGSQALQGAGIQQGAASTLGSQLLQAAGLQQGAASTLGSQALQGLGLQTQALSGLSDAYKGGVQNAVQGLYAAPTIQGLPYNDINNLFGAGAAQQGLQQQDINSDVSRWNFNQTLPYQQLSQYLGAITGNYGGQTTAPFFGGGAGNVLGAGLAGASLLGGNSGGLGGLFGGGAASLGGDFGGGGAALGIADSVANSTAAAGGLGDIGSLLGAGLAISSDRRLKTDIEEIAKLANGLPLYKFRYRGDPRMVIGLMADEVEKVRPEAVVDGPFGFKMVNYELAVQ